MKLVWQLFESIIRLSLIISIISDFWRDQVTIETVCVLLIILWNVLLDIKAVIAVKEMIISINSEKEKS